MKALLTFIWLCWLWSVPVHSFLFRSTHPYVARLVFPVNLLARPPDQIEEEMSRALDTLKTNSTSLLLFPTVRECNSALATLGDSGCFLDALRLFFKMRQSTKYTSWIPVPAPTLVTYSTLMSRLIKAKKPEIALRIWNLRDPTLSIDTRAANILMNGYAKLGQLSSAVQLLLDMNDRKSTIWPHPNAVTYNTYLAACQEHGNLDLAVQALEEMKAKRLRPDTRTYTTLIATVGRNASATYGRYDPSLAFEFLTEMKAHSILPNGKTYSALIDACARCGRPDQAILGLRMMLTQNSSLSDSVGAWTAAITACGKSGRLETALELFYKMVKFGVLPNTITCGSLTDSLLKHGKTAETLQILRYMKQNNIQPSEVMYTSLMRRAEHLVKLERRQRHFSDTTRAIEIYTELIESLIQSNNNKSNNNNNKHGGDGTIRRRYRARDSSSMLLLKAFLLLQEMESSNVVIDLPCYHALLRACAQAQDLQRAQSVLRKITASSLIPSDVTWRLLLKSAKPHEVEHVWRQGLGYRKVIKRQEEVEVVWQPSVESLLVLWSSFVRAGEESGNKSYLQQVLDWNDSILNQNDDEMQRINYREVYRSRRAMTLLLRVALSMDDYRLVSKLLNAQCLRDPRRLSPPSKRTLQRARNYVRQYNSAVGK